MKFFYFIAFVFALFSSLRLGFLPEIQLLIIVLLIFIYKGVNKRVLFVVVAVLCTHHYAIPDGVLRFDAGNYPSIYTKEYLGVKILDVLILSIFIMSFKYVDNLKYFLNKNLPFFIIPFAFLGLFYLSAEKVAFDILLFTVRSYLLIIAIYLIAYSLSFKEMVDLSKLAIFSWTLKMFFSIVFPHEYPLYRETFGFDGIIYFAGDEYLTIGVYLSIILLLASFSSYEKFKTFLFLNFIFLLTLIAQRKGGIPYFLILNVILFLSFYIKSLYIHKIFNTAVFVNIFAVFLMFNVFYVFIPDIIKLGFVEYNALSTSAIQSILSMGFYNQFFGITPFGKYEIIGLESIFDHAMSFGKEVGNVYRYQIWTIPGGRLVLNIGIVGALLLYIFLLYKALNEKVAQFYLILSLLPFFYLALITPVSALSIGLALAAYIKHKKFGSARISVSQKPGLACSNPATVTASSRGVMPSPRPPASASASSNKRN